MSAASSILRQATMSEIGRIFPRAAEPTLGVEVVSDPVTADAYEITVFATWASVNVWRTSSFTMSADDVRRNRHPVEVLRARLRETVYQVVEHMQTVLQ